MRTDKRSIHPRLAELAIACALGLSSPAFATNGYFAHGFGTESKAMAGVGVAMALDGLSIANNPAVLTDVEEGLDVGISYFSPDRGYTVSGGPTGACLSAQQCTFGIGTGSVSSDKGQFFIPHMGFTRKLDENTAIGIALYGNGGMNTRYLGGSATFGVPMGDVPPGVGVTMDGTFGNGTTGVDLMQLFIAPTWARRFENGASIGISPIIAMQLFEARGLANFAPFSQAPDKLTDNGHDVSWGYGLRFGASVPAGDRLRFGFAYQTRMSMSKFDDYAGLFAEQGDFDIPSNATIGLALKANERLTLAFDVQWIGYSQVDAIGNPMLPNLMMGPLGSDTGAGFGWNDMTTFKLGGSWRANEVSTWFAGVSHGDQPVESSEVLFNVLAPGVIEDHFTAGYSHHLPNGNRWSISLMYAPSKKVRGMNPLDPAQRIEFSMDQVELEFGYHFGR